MKPFVPQKLPVDNINWNKIISIIASANREVGKFDALLTTIPNADVLLSPLTMNEAVLSSRIEGTQATLEEVYEFEANPKLKTEKSEDIKEILNYRKAIRVARNKLKKLPLSARLIKEIHKVLLSGVRGKQNDPGNFRSSPVFIGPPGAGIENATYIPPDSNLIPEYFSNLEKYIHSDEKDKIVQLAIVHAQFEIIHPFLDGNGRTGRILMPLFLYYKSVISTPNFYLSEYFEKNRDEYYEKLNNISKNNDWDDWINYFLKAVTIQSRKNTGKVEEILSLYHKTLDEVQTVTRSQYTHKIVEFIFSQLLFSSTDISNKTIPKPSAKTLLKRLVDNGILEIWTESSGRKPAIYGFPKLLKIVL
ncbi:Fic family protein [candidate division KSB1 bacterium]